jgi:hypothetical protein
MLAPEAPARRVLSLCRLYAGRRAIGVTPQEGSVAKTASDLAQGSVHR